MPIIIEEDNRNLILFFVITFAFSWSLWCPSLLATMGIIKYRFLYDLLRIIGGFGPFIGAFSLTLYNEGVTGARILWSRAWHYENWRYLLIALFLLPFLNFISLLMAVVTEGIPFPRLSIWNDYMFILVDFIFYFFIAGPFQEEFGWRGYVLDILQFKWNALESSLILGAIWSLWHLPLFYITNTAHTNDSFLSFTFAVIIMSILFTWLYNNSDGSIFVVMIFHASNNISSTLFPLNTTVLGNVYYAILLDLVVVIILIVYNYKTLMRKSSEMGIRGYRKYERLIT